MINILCNNILSCLSVRILSNVLFSISIIQKMWRRKSTKGKNVSATLCLTGTYFGQCVYSVLLCYLNKEIMVWYKLFCWFLPTQWMPLGRQLRYKLTDYYYYLGHRGGHGATVCVRVCVSKNTCEKFFTNKCMSSIKIHLKMHTKYIWPMFLYFTCILKCIK